MQVLRLREILSKSKISAEIIDIRSLRPLDKKTIIKSLKKTRKVLVVDNGWKTYGIGSEIISILSEEKSINFKSKPMRLGIKELPIPSSRAIATESYLSPQKILDAISKVSSKKINLASKKEFENKYLHEPTDVPYKDFKGPF